MDYDAIARAGGIGKGQTRKAKKTANRKVQNAVIAATRAQVFVLDPKCICGTCPASDADQMHEVISRAKTRGMPPEQRFSVRICVRLSPRCHEDTTGRIGAGKVLRIAFENDLLGAMGKIRLSWKDRRVVIYQRKVVE